MKQSSQASLFVAVFAFHSLPAAADP